MIKHATERIKKHGIKTNLWQKPFAKTSWAFSGLP